MRDRGIDRNEEVKIGDQGSGIGEIRHLGHQVGELRVRGRRRAVLLQAEEVHPGQVEQGRQPVRGQGAPDIGPQGRVARPCQADPAPRKDHGSKAHPPGRDLQRVGLQIGADRNGGERGAESQRQAEHRAVQIEVRQGFAAPHHLIDPREALEQPDQGLRHLHDHAQPACRGQWRVAAELQGVAEALLGMDQQRPSRRRLPPPLRLGKVTPGLEHMRALPAPFVFLPARRHIPPRQQRHRQVVMRPRKVRLEVDSPLVAGARLVQPPQLLQRVAQVVVRLGKVRLEVDSPAAACNRLVQPPQSRQRIAQVVMGLRIVRPQLESHAAAGDRLVRPPLFRKRVGKVVECLRIAGPQHERPAVAGNRRLQPAPVAAARGPNCCAPPGPRA